MLGAWWSIYLYPSTMMSRELCHFSKKWDLLHCISIYVSISLVLTASFLPAARGETWRFEHLGMWRWLFSVSNRIIPEVAFALGWTSFEATSSFSWTYWCSYWKCQNVTFAVSSYFAIRHWERYQAQDMCTGEGNPTINTDICLLHLILIFILDLQCNSLFWKILFMENLCLFQEHKKWLLLTKILITICHCYEIIGWLFKGRIVK